MRGWWLEVEEEEAELREKESDEKVQERGKSKVWRVEECVVLSTWRLQKQEPVRTSTCPAPSPFSSIITLTTLFLLPRFTLGALLKTNTIHWIASNGVVKRIFYVTWCGVVGHACDPISDTETQRERERIERLPVRATPTWADMFPWTCINRCIPF